MKKEDLVVGEKYEVTENTQYFAVGEVVIYKEDLLSMVSVYNVRTTKPISVESLKPYKPNAKLSKALKDLKAISDNVNRIFGTNKPNEMKKQEKQEKIELITEAWNDGYVRGASKLDSHDVNLQAFLKSKGLGDELEVEKVYKCTKSDALIMYNGNHELNYGFDNLGGWTNRYVVGSDSPFFKLSTEAEWQSALIAEWEKTPTNRKFKNYSYHFNNTVGMKGLMFGWDVLGEELFTVFDNGKWATIISEPTEAEKIEILWNERNK